jgi:hypothetical protein
VACVTDGVSAIQLVPQRSRQMRLPQRPAHIVGGLAGDAGSEADGPGS